MIVKEILENKKRPGEIISVAIDSKIKDAVKVMVECDTGSCVITDADGKLVGMITFREVLKQLYATPDTCAQAQVKDLMDNDPIIATPEDTVDQIRSIMISKHVRYLPIMSAGKLTDVISFYDVARALAKQTDFENRMLKQYINDWPEGS